MSFGRYLSSGAVHSPKFFFDIPQCKMRSSTVFEYSAIMSTLKLIVTNLSSSSMSSYSSPLCSSSLSSSICSSCSGFSILADEWPPSSSSWSNAESLLSSSAGFCPSFPPLNSSSSLEELLSTDFFFCPLFFFACYYSWCALKFGSIRCPCWLYCPLLMNTLILRSSLNY